jgi:acyl-CoA thioesterase II
MVDPSTIPLPLKPERVTADRHAIVNTGNAGQRDVVFGGQFLAQAIVLASLEHPGKTVRSIQSIFARPGRIDAPTELAIESIHDGRTFASDTVTAWQGDRLCARFLVLLDVDEPDVIRHGAPMPAVTAPADTPITDEGLLVYPGTELRIVDGVDLWCRCTRACSRGRPTAS